MITVDMVVFSWRQEKGGRDTWAGTLQLIWHQCVDTMGSNCKSRRSNRQGLRKALTRCLHRQLGNKARNTGEATLEAYICYNLFHGNMTTTQYVAWIKDTYLSDGFFGKRNHIPFQGEVQLAWMIYDCESALSPSLLPVSSLNAPLNPGHPSLATFSSTLHFMLYTVLK